VARLPKAAAESLDLANRSKQSAAALLAEAARTRKLIAEALILVAKSGQLGKETGWGSGTGPEEGAPTDRSTTDRGS
jgi:hypothetical protein